MVEDEGLAGDLHRMLDERNILRVKKGRIIIRQRVRDAVDNLIAEQDRLVNIIHERNKTMSDYFALVQAAYDFNAETGYWHLKNPLPTKLPVSAIPVGSEESRKLDI